MRRWGALGPAAVLVLAACSPSGGGAQGSSAAASSAGGGTGSNPPAAQPSTGGGDGGGVGAFGDASFAVVVFEGERYEWTDIHCFSIAGSVGGSGRSGNNTIWFQLPSPDWAGDPLDDNAPGLHVQFDDGGDDYVDWVAGGASNGADDQTLLAGGIDEWAIEQTQGTGGQYDFDHRATGTATFVSRSAMADWQFENNEWDAPVPEEALVRATGTFEVTCV